MCDSRPVGIDVVLCHAIASSRLRLRVKPFRSPTIDREKDASGMIRSDCYVS